MQLDTSNCQVKSHAKLLLMPSLFHSRPQLWVRGPIRMVAFGLLGWGCILMWGTLPVHQVVQARLIVSAQRHPAHRLNATAVTGATQGMVDGSMGARHICKHSALVTQTAVGMITTHTILGVICARGQQDTRILHLKTVASDCAKGNPPTHLTSQYEPGRRVQRLDTLQ